MKLQAVITEGAPAGLIEAFGSCEFARAGLDVIAAIIGVDKIAERPGEYNVLKPRLTTAVNEGTWGVKLQLTDVSRNGRPTKVFHQLLKALDALAEMTIRRALPAGSRARLRTVMELDGEIEDAPGSGSYSRVPATEARDVESAKPDRSDDGSASARNDNPYGLLPDSTAMQPWNC